MSDRDLKDGLKAAGYSFEEMWFYRHNQELLDELREKEEASGRPKLRLIQGGLSESSSEPAPEEATPAVKKAA